MKVSAKTLVLSLSLALIALTAAPTPATAHEGHGMPTSLQAQHGGEIKVGKEINLELVRSGKEIQLFPMEHEEYKPVALGDLKVTGVAKLQGKGKGTPVTFAAVAPKSGADAAQGHFAGSFDPGSKRHVLEVTVTRGSKKDLFKFQLEPRS